MSDSIDPTSVLGVMSGSSLDGLDLALCKFEINQNEPIKWKLLDTSSISIPDELVEQLQKSPSLDALSLLELHTAFGTWAGHVIKNCAIQNSWSPELLAFHGHTVFHFPEKAVSFQLGHGAALSEATEWPVIVDLRSNDMATGGQGAPMVGIAEQSLWPGYDAYLNLGGIVNISVYSQQKIASYDIGPGNQLLNHLSKEAGANFDEGGMMARHGKVHLPLLEEWKLNSWFRKPPPKAMDNSWIRDSILPVLENYQDISITDKLRTAVELIAFSVKLALPQDPLNILVTGGGTHNTFLMERIQSLSAYKFHVSDVHTIDFKEAIMIAYAGWLRIQGKSNFIPKVTGASKAARGGAVYLPGKKL